MGGAGVLRARVLTAAVAIPPLVWLIVWAPTWIYNIVILATTFVALREFAEMGLGGISGARTTVVAGGMVIAVAMGLGQSGTAISAGIVACLAGVLLSTLATAQDMEKSVSKAAHILLGCLYGGVLLPHFIWLRGVEDGSAWVIFLLACAMAGDAGGYFGGAAFGSRKLWPTVSPQKTVEGALVSMFASLAAGVAFNHLVLGKLGGVEVLCVAGVISVLGQTGDLLESMIKRAYDAKDSGGLFPGHGGVLDRTDSLILPVVFVYYYASFIVG
jgi:phosphatidate cytidylyltransferase